MNEIIKKLNTLSFKLILLFSTLFLIFGLFNHVYYSNYIKDELSRNELKKADLVGNLVSSALGAGIYFMDKESIENETNNLFKLKNTLFVLLSNESDSLIFSKRRNITNDLKYHINTRNSFISDTLLFSVTNIYFNKKYLGRVHIGYSLAESITNISKQSIVFMTFSLILSVIGIAILIIISILVTRQLNAIIRTARNVKSGVLSERVKITSNDEVGLLARNFNDMLDNIEELYTNLERKVISRTYELNEANLLLQSEILFKEATALQLGDLLSEKEVLLKEIHHRVKNNLQVISSLLYLQSKKSASNENHEIFNDSQNRIKSMALVHEQLYKSDDLSGIQLPDYINALVNTIIRSNNSNSKMIKLDINVEHIFLSIDKSMPFGLIVNELVTNSLKYAFNGREDGILKVVIKKEDNGIIKSSISDNGIGLPEGIDITKTTSLGLKLVQTLVSQLEGKFDITSNGGTEFIIEFDGSHKSKS